MFLCSSAYVCSRQRSFLWESFVVQDKHHGVNPRFMHPQPCSFSKRVRVILLALLFSSGDGCEYRAIGLGVTLLGQPIATQVTSGYPGCNLVHLSHCTREMESCVVSDVRSLVEKLSHLRVFWDSGSICQKYNRRYFVCRPRCYNFPKQLSLSTPLSVSGRLDE